MPREALQTKLEHPQPAVRMTAAVLYGSQDLRIEQVDVPVIAPDEILLRVRAALTDGTDLKVWKCGYHARMIQPPAIFGHEVMGEIAEIGADVDPRWRIGMRVVPANSAPCLSCFYCRRAQENLCEDLLFNNGAYAEYMRIPGRIVRENLLEVPDHVSDLDAALIEPLACVMRGIDEMNIQPGGSAVVIGCGPIGLTFVRMLANRGARVIALGKRSEQLDSARRLGAHVALNVTELADPVRAVRKLTGGERGADGVVEAAGSTTTWQWALAMVRRGGVVNLFSGLPEGARMEIEPAAIHYSEITIKSTFHHTPRHFREALGAVARGEISALDFVSREVRLAELPAAFEKMKSARSVIKLAIRP
jgi:L-iditol 2-dehydrogenase